MQFFFHRFGIHIILLTWLLWLEAWRIVHVAGAELAGPWELSLVTRGATAILLVLSAFVFCIISLASFFLKYLQSVKGRLIWASVFTFVSIAFALAMSTGRKARMLSIRVPFVLICAAGAACFMYWVAPKLLVSARTKRGLFLGIGLIVLVATYLADRFVLPRLYPTFHFSLMLLMLVAIAFCTEGILAWFETQWLQKYKKYALGFLAFVGLWLLISASSRFVWAGKGFAKYENARRVVQEHSLILGRMLQLISYRWPPPQLDLGDEINHDPDPLLQDVSRSVYAQNYDILLVTIDALRADHVGAYGYPRATTPFLDSLAQEGVVFNYAYTPTPHTSYAIASLMTGKFLKPIFALESASLNPRDPDETWAGVLRTYGYRTAAFYPPAIFHVDAERFEKLSKNFLDFEYSKIEFATPRLRAAQLDSYLSETPKDKPVFAWVHLFEPHEPYVKHAEYDFGNSDIDRYDSEIAMVDAGLRKIVQKFRAVRPRSMVIVTADHGEAFGEHNARYHGTTVFEEQVRVPLVISAPSLITPTRVVHPVQVIDVFPTMLSALGIPKSPRIRGRDMGPLMVQKTSSLEQGIALSEVDDSMMLAQGVHRLICNRRSSTCALYNLEHDPMQTKPLSLHDPKVASITQEMRRNMAAILATSARLEGVGANQWPDSLRRAFAGDVQVALDVAALLDDVDVGFRRKAAEALTRLAQPDTLPHLMRALNHEVDSETRTWLAIAQLRAQTKKNTTGLFPQDVQKTLISSSLLQQRYAAIALAEACHTYAPQICPLDRATRIQIFRMLVEQLPTIRDDIPLIQISFDVLPTLLEHQDPSFIALRSKITQFLQKALDDIRLRSQAIQVLPIFADQHIASWLEKRIQQERHLDMRAPLIVALDRLGQHEVALRELVRVLGVPQPAPNGGAVLREIVSLYKTKPQWLAYFEQPQSKISTTITVPIGKQHRLILVGPTGNEKPECQIETQKFQSRYTDAGWTIELDDFVEKSKSNFVRVDCTTSQTTIAMIAILPLVQDIPPPKADRDVELAP